MRLKKVISSALLVTLISNLNILTFTYAFAGASILFSKAAYALQAAPSDTPKLDEIKGKYGLSNPTRNHQSDEIPTKIQSLIDNPGSSRDLTGQITNTLNNGQPPRVIDLNKYNDPANPNSFLNYQNLAITLSKTHGAPSGTISSEASGDSISTVNMEYSRTGTRQFVRDENGKMVMKVIPSSERVTSINSSDVYSSEVTPGHPGYDYENGKAVLYGDEQGIWDEGELALLKFKDPANGKSASARGYRALTAGASKAIQQPSPMQMLQPSFDKLEETQDPNLWLSSCTVQTIPTSSTFSSASSREHFCQDTSQANMDFCEVERDIKIPVYSSSPGLRSCGAGCYEFDLNIDVWKTSRCRSTSGGNGGDPATFTLNLNLAQGIAIKNVAIKGTAADHFLFSLNGQKLWESDQRNQAPVGNYEVGSCNLSGHTHQIDTNITNRVNQIVGPLADNGVYSMTFRGDIRWKRNGGMAATVRFEVEDTSGDGLETRYIQYPEGCYDALTLEDKLVNGLDGVYDFKQFGIDDSLPPLRYQCVSAPRQPICKAGDVLFGSAGQEKCYTPPLPPVCPSGVYNEDSQRCEYPATINCPTLSGVACGIDPSNNPKFPIVPESILNGLMCTYTDAEHCGTSWSYDAPANVSCPNGGTPDGALCVSFADISAQCDIDAGYSYKTLMINGEEVQRCEGPTIGYTPNTWSCDAVNGVPQTFSETYCSLSFEDYRDEDGNPIPTIDENGFPINPPFYDEDGEIIEFSDVAQCIKPQLLPDVDPIDLPQSFCTFDEYESMEESTRGFPDDLLAQIPPFFAGDTGNRTWKVNLKKYRCDPTQGRLMCFPDPDTGEEKCYDWEDLKNLPERCAIYKQDETCSEIARECTEGWLEPISGRCMAETVTYRCDTETVIDYETTRDVNTCESMIPCVGGNCNIDNPETNGRFVEAMVAGSILDNIQGDSSCADPSDPSTCKIFEGDYKYCSWETSGLGADCCEEAKGVDILGYVVFTRQMLKVNQMAYSGAFGDGISGGYQRLAEPITDGYKVISDWASKGIRSASESIFGNTAATTSTQTGAITAATDGITAALSALQQQVYRFVYDMLPESLANLVFTTTGGAAAGAAGEQAGDLVLNETITNFMSNVMAIYAVYSMAKLALTLLTACDEHEMDMGIKLAQRQCFKVGDNYCNKRYPALGAVGACMQKRQDYCCYSSILARIVMKESYNQLGINPLPFGTKLKAGTPEAEGSCVGLSPDQLSQLDFNTPSMQTALNEWIGLLLESGSLPTETDEQSLTGGATAVDASCPPEYKPVITCNISPETLEEECMQARDAQGNPVFEEIPSQCVKKLTPGQIWNAEDRKKAGDRITGEDGYLNNSQDRIMEGKNQIKGIINNLDCSVTPRPPVCEFRVNPLD